jgi:hypothetical protein
MIAREESENACGKTFYAHFHRDRWRWQFQLTSVLKQLPSSEGVAPSHDPYCAQRGFHAEEILIGPCSS